MGNTSERTPGHLLCRSGDWPWTSLSYTRTYTIYIIYNITRWEEGAIKAWIWCNITDQMPQTALNLLVFVLSPCVLWKEVHCSKYNLLQYYNANQHHSAHESAYSTYNKYFLKTIYNITSCEHLDVSKISFFLQRLKKFWLSSSVLNSLAPGYPFTFHLKIRFAYK